MLLIIMHVSKLLKNFSICNVFPLQKPSFQPIYGGSFYKKPFSAKEFSSLFSDGHPDFSMLFFNIEFKVIVAVKFVFLTVGKPFCPDFSIDLLQSLGTFSVIRENRP